MWGMGYGGQGMVVDTVVFSNPHPPSPSPSAARSLSSAVRMVVRGGGCGAYNIARATAPTPGTQVRSAAITATQKRVRSLSSASSDNQATRVLSDEDSGLGAACVSVLSS